ncbi:hypothetical protein [Persephonella sp.]
MGKVRNVELLAELLKRLKDLECISSVEVVNIPEDVEADIGLKMWVEPGCKWQDVLEKVNDIIWELFEETGELLAVYKDFENAVYINK